MKRMSRIICTLATLLMSLGAVQANAALKAFSTNFVYDTLSPPNPLGMPSWFQGQDGVAVAPCLVAGCGLLAGGTFVSFPAGPFPANYPVEGFYFLAQSNKFLPIGAATCDIFAALEFTTFDPITLKPGVTPVVGLPMATFQRLRLAVQGVVAPGTWTVQHPWGTTTFDSVVDCKNRAVGCQMTRDVPLPTANDFLATLGPAAPLVPAQFTMDTFVKSTTAPAGFLGDAVTPSTFTGGTVRQFFQITDPNGATTGPQPLAIITGKTVGMDVQPGNKPNLGALLITATTPGTGTPSAPNTVTVTNATGNNLDFPALALAGVDAGDFAISAVAPPAPAINCSGAVTLPPNGTCNVTTTFNPLPAAKAARVATIALVPILSAVQPLGAGTTPPPPITLSLSGTAHVKIVSTVSTPHGAITQDVAVDPATGGVPAGVPVTFTVTPHNKKFKVKSVDDGGALLGTPVGAPPFTINTGSINHTITATFMPSGDLDASGTLEVADALKALKIVAGVQQPDVDDPNNSAVKVAPLGTDGKPAALDAKANPDIGDVLVILRRVLNLDTW